MEDITIVNKYMHGMCRELAREINSRTELPIYGIRDVREKVYIWGYDYWHVFIKIDHDLYLDCSGLHQGIEIKKYWADMYNDESIIQYGIIEPVNEVNDLQRDKMTRNVASYLISKYDL